MTMPDTVAQNIGKRILGLFSGRRHSQVVGVTDTPEPQRSRIPAPRSTDPWLESFVGGRFGSPSIASNPDPVLYTEAAGKSGLCFRYPGGLYVESLLKDAHAQACFNQRASRVAEAPLRIGPNGDDEKAILAADLCRTAADKMIGGGMSQFIFDLMSAIPYGLQCPMPVWTLGEFALKKQNGESGLSREWLYAEWFEMCDPRRIGFTIDGTPRLITESHLSDGEPIPQGSMLFFRPYNRYGNPYGTPLAANIFYLMYSKRKALGYWWNLAEKYSFPIALFTPKGGKSDSELDAVQGIAEDITYGTSAVLPSEFEHDFVETGKSGSEILRSLVNVNNGEMSRLILGQDFTAQQADKGGTRSAGEIYDEVAARIARQDATAVADFLRNVYFRMLVQYNLGADHPLPIVEIDTRSTAEKLQESQVIVSLANTGYRFTQNQMSKRFGYDWADKDDEWMKPPSAEPQLADTRPAYDQSQNPRNAAGQANRQARQATNA